MLPQGADQHVNGAALARSGAGVRLPSELATTEAIAGAVSRVLADGPERAAAWLLFEQIAAMPDPEGTIAQLTTDRGTGPGN
jgi:UDP:flavonoid glycosyltransferase YjiC (YdhE family)